jgi:uncharacterized protein DUF6883
MSPLPHFERAIVDIRKLSEYCLNPAHPRGRHKARVFLETLGINQDDADWLKQILLDGVRQREAVGLEADPFGSRWRVDIPIARHESRVVLRTLWIIKTGEEMPRFVTCWVL